MGLTAGAVVTLEVERPVAGGRMLARHEGQIVLLSGAIPGERVVARVERAAKSVAHAETIEVLTPSADRRAGADGRCGGRDYAHVAYARQQALKAEVIADAFRRVGRLPLSEVPAVVASPEHGYRLRSRLHASNGRLGFLREGSHDLCAAGPTGQLSAGTLEWLLAAERHLTAGAAGGLAERIVAVELAEDLPGLDRAAHVEMRGAVDLSALAPLAEGLVGLSAQGSLSNDVVTIAGTPEVTDRLHIRSGDAKPALTLTRNVRSFFQGNRFLLEWLVQHVVTLIAAAPIVDLYAGVGLFGLAAAAAGHEAITLVEGDRTSGADLDANARAFAPRVRVVRQSVEAALAGLQGLRFAGTCIVDPPRTGLSPAARDGVLRMKPARLIYVSCDVATLARDSRALVDAGYELAAITGVDLFPSTAHVETVAVLDRVG